MLFDQFLSGNSGKLLPGVLPEQFSIWHLGASFLVFGLLALVIDYAYMLYMRSKLVSFTLHPPLPLSSSPKVLF